MASYKAVVPNLRSADRYRATDQLVPGRTRNNKLFPFLNYTEVANRRVRGREEGEFVSLNGDKNLQQSYLMLQTDNFISAAEKYFIE